MLLCEKEERRSNGGFVSREKDKASLLTVFYDLIRVASKRLNSSLNRQSSVVRCVVGHSEESEDLEEKSIRNSGKSYIQGNDKITRHGRIDEKKKESVR